MESSNGLERKLENFLKEYSRNKYSVMHEPPPRNKPNQRNIAQTGTFKGAKVFIKERRIICQAHNSWRGLTEDCVVIMSRLDNNGIRTAGSVLTIKGVPLSS